MNITKVDEVNMTLKRPSPRGSSVDGGSSERLQLLAFHPHLEKQEAKNNLDLVKKEKVIQHNIEQRGFAEEKQQCITLNLASRP